MTKSILSFNIGDKVSIEVARNLCVYGVISDYVQYRADKLFVQTEDGERLVCELNDLEKVED